MAVRGDWSRANNEVGSGSPPARRSVWGRATGWRRTTAVTVVAIVGVAGLGTALRVVTLKADAPYATYVDEWATLKGSARQISDTTWDPGWYHYPAFLMDATTVAASALAAVGGDSNELRDGARATITTPYIEIVEPWSLVIAGRLVVLALAIANIVLVALLGTRLAGRRVGLLAALFVAVLPIFVTRGSIVISDTAAAAFATAALYCSARVVTASSRRQLVTWLVIGGGASGLACTSKYTIGTVLLAVCVAVALRQDRSVWDRLKLGGLAVAAFALIAALSTPALVFRTSEVVDALEFLERSYTTRPPTESYWEQLLHAREFGRLMLLAGFAGLVLLARSRRARPIVFAYLAFAIPTLALLLRAGFQPVRNILPLIPFVAIAAAATIVEAVRFVGARLRLSHQSQALVAVVIALALCWAPLQGGTRRYIATERGHVDTRTWVRQWVAARVHDDERVLVAEEVSMLPGELRRICADVTLGSQRRAAPVDTYDWVVLGDQDDPRWPSPWEDALARQPPTWSIGDYPMSGSKGGVRIQTQPLEQVWHDNRERIYVFGPADALARDRRDAPCSSSDRTVGVLTGELPQMQPGTASTREGDAATRALQVPVSLSIPSDQPITIAWQTQPRRVAAAMDELADFLDASPADTPDDYPERNGTVTFRPGDTHATITVTIEGDTEPEPDEFVLIAFAPTAGDVKVGGLFGLGVVEISDDD
jgi:Dolichyl-phosphate-mannose-protein mannosyltransferase